MTPRSKKKQKTLLLLLLGFPLAVLAGTGIFILLVVAGTFGKLPGTRALMEVRNPLATEIYSADGVLMGTYNVQNRQHMDSLDITPVLRSALVATEDVRFYDHRGIDYRSLFRVLFKGLLLGDEAAGGGSTLSQQLAKNLFPRGDHGLLSMPVNKVREMVIARRLERIYSKEEILALYLSTVPFGENTFGFKTASRRYFNKDPQDLRMEETAVLVGMLKATHSYNPVRYPVHSRERRNVVLAQMARYAFLEDTLKDSLQALPLLADYHPLPHNAGIAPYFREHLRKEMESWCAEHSRDGESFNLYSDGLKIHTTIDSRLQAYAEDAMRSHMARLQVLFEAEWKGHDRWRGMDEKSLVGGTDAPPRSMQVFSWEGKKLRELSRLDSAKYFLSFLQAGFLAMDVESAEIRAWVGGIDHEFFKYDHVLSRRQPGSAFKPLIFMEALEQGMKPCAYFPNDSVVYEDYDSWTPRNADRRYGGFYSMNGAMVHSVNTVSVDLLMRAGIDSVLQRCRLAGISSPLPPVPSLALGTGEVSLLEMVGVFQAIANRGILREPVCIRRIEDRHGKVLEEFSPDFPGMAVCQPENADRLTVMMEAVVNEGTAAALRDRYQLRGAMAGKTGTTQNQTDGWFIGYTPHLVAGAWVGGDLQNIRFRSITHGQGARSAMPIWAGFMERTADDPHWNIILEDTFPVSPEIRAEFECEHYLEKKPFEFKPFRKLREKDGRWRLFKRRKRR